MPELKPQPGEKLDCKGRCCGCKPIAYRVPTIHYFCCRCDREYDADGKQKQNWAWRDSGDGTFTPRYASVQQAADAWNHREESK